MAAGWDADRYQRQFGFVSAMAGDLADYWRLRFVALAGTPAETASPASTPQAAKLHRQMNGHGGL